MRRLTLIICLLISYFIPTFGQSGHTTDLRFEKVVYNFGKISIDDGPQKGSFKYKNISDKPIVINNVISSCGCSVAEYVKSPIKPGEEGEIVVTYLNDQGPYPFDKTFTVYISSSQKPIILRIAGIVYEKGKTSAELFPNKFGPLGMRKEIQNGGQIEQGLQRSESESVINLSDKKVTVSFKNVSPGLSIQIKPSTLDPGESAIISYTINTKLAKHWGRTRYYASFVCNGVEQKKKFITETTIVTPYTSLTQEEIDNGPRVQAEKSSIEFDSAKVGEKFNAKFNLKNIGKKKLIIYKVETNGANIKITCPDEINVGEKVTLNAVITPKEINNYEVFTITLVTNSPERPLVNLFVSGEIVK